MRVRTTTLAENTAVRPGTLGEQGLAILVEVDDFQLLLDTGLTNTVVHNARALRVNLSKVRHIVLSHGHSDHTGGLRDVVSELGKVQIHAHPEVWRPRYIVRQCEGDIPRYIGLPFVREHLEALGATFKLSDGPEAITPEMTTTGPIPRLTSFERVDPELRLRTAAGWEQDQIPDDQALVVKTPGGLIVLLGCAHSGMVNTLRRAQEVSGDERILAVLGGTHLGFSGVATRELLEETVVALKELGIGRLGVSHCTGLPTAARLAQQFGDRFFFNNVGTVIEWEF